VSQYPLIFSVLFLSVFIFLFYFVYLKFRLKKFEIEKRYLIELKRIEKSSLSETSESPLQIEEKTKFIENNGVKK
jgi:hypothetical protein